MLKSRSSLKQKTALKSYSRLQRKSKQRKKRLPLEKKTAPQLVEVADKYFSWYIRLRDSDLVEGQWWGKCITCNKRYLVRDSEGHWTNYVDNGHFIGRGHKVVRFDEENCNLQCKRCNKWLSGNYTVYKFALDDKYGVGTAAKLEKLVHDTPLYSFTKPELLQIIEDAKTQVAFYEHAK